MPSGIGVALPGQAAGFPLGRAVRVALPTKGGRAVRLYNSRSSYVRSAAMRR